jgi:hypothetical protein
MKLNIRKKLVSVAVASALTGVAMMAVPAHAMNVSQNNLGEVLLFPYYTVKAGNDTLFSITNTSADTAVIKVRWREALNSREVRDFNVVLSPYDMWTGVVTSTADGTGALIRTFDNTCTSPQLPAGPFGSREIGFTNALFSGKYADGATESVDRVREGYFEVFLMGQSSRSTSVSSNTLEYNAKHVNGVPRDCAKVDAQFLDVGANINPYMSAPMNVLKGHSTIINVSSGKAIDFEPTALENFSSQSGAVYPPGNEKPSLADGDSFSTGYRLVDGNSLSFGYAQSYDGVSELLRASSVINEYVTGSNVAGSWVVTFPTKHHYTDRYTDAGSVANDPVVPGGGFSDWFFTKNSSGAVVDGKSCDDITLISTDREEARQSSGTDFSPVVGESAALCYEVNVLNFNNTGVFGAGTNHYNLQTVGAAGWLALTFAEDTATSVGGLPVIGFSAVVRDSGDATVNYGSAIEHSYKYNGAM